MTQKEHLLELFHTHANKLTLGQILNTHLAAEYRARMSELRKEGYRIDFVKGEKPSEGTCYLMTPPKAGCLL